MTTENSALNQVNCHVHVRPRICWSAVLVGAFVGIGLSFLLHLFALAIGLSAYHSSSTGGTAIAIGGILGLLIGTIVSMGTAGFVAGYLGRFHYCYCHGGVIYGFATWSIALILSALVTIPLSSYISSYTRGLAPTVMSKSLISETSEAVTINNSSEDNPNAQSNMTKDITGSISTEDLIWSAWIVFILFFVGALSSCIGACWGMCCKQHGPCTTSSSSEPPAS